MSGVLLNSPDEAEAMFRQIRLQISTEVLAGIMQGEYVLAVQRGVSEADPLGVAEGPTSIAIHQLINYEIAAQVAFNSAMWLMHVNGMCDRPVVKR